MKITNLLAVLCVATNTASALELPRFLRGIVLEDGNYGCDVNADCNNNEYCNSRNNCVLKCDDNNDCNNNEYCPANGICHQYCDWNSDCASNNCNRNTGICAPNNNRSNRQNCNFKQCNKKKSCSCPSEDVCVKGGEVGANTCNTSGENNGCCVRDPTLGKDAQAEE
mmetsp:Transcript_34982/g.84459  ORF Transcript_34982/g.84459 Transcript_34982/m.84459 type:complete len:167 (+) Transcript_34982:237-737(+)|eukprot:CAMPEP_0181127254 /NCGR_PEP_ID=MMETSP1071-20121207/28093_1 /TAXON_ID=35127 /ORGANISM="Thalassiosira sp., Strain NH16" /LENGTH=166 /DNA_ID=CAMNT_0023212967 /DNA_START=192 /DNA_END=692 /DNA_ORIENTATION=+